jgi:hypothetical protein
MLVDVLCISLSAFPTEGSESALPVVLLEQPEISVIASPALSIVWVSLAM